MLSADVTSRQRVNNVKTNSLINNWATAGHCSKITQPMKWDDTILKLVSVAETINSLYYTSGDSSHNP